MPRLYIVLLIASLFFAVTETRAQVPQRISYQAVVRGSNGDILANTTVGLRIGILQGSPTGTAIYQEVYSPNPQTNAYGILTIQIGSGNPQIGNFSSINWATGTYYVRVEVDPSGGTNYTDMGSAQLLTVPYAFYSGATATEVPLHYVGEFFGGGIVFYVDHTGQHGLILSVVEQSAASGWSDHPTTLIGATAQSDWDGQSNSAAIILQSTSASAADLCDAYVNTDYGTGVYTDWYLPAIDQLCLIYHAKYIVNKALESDGNGVTVPLEKATYWSSTESTAISAWAYYFVTGTVIGNDKLCTPVHVRAVRSF